MKVKIFTEGGPNIGLGHISRCTSLYDEIKKQNHEVDFFVFGNVEEIELLKNKEITSADWFNKKFLNENIGSEDYCIVDSYLANRETLETLSMKAKRVLFIDDTNRITYPPGIIVNPALGIGDLKYDLTAGQELYYGAEYVILRDAFHNVKRTRYRDEIEKVLITMGGTDTANVTPHIIDSLCSVYSEIDFAVVVSQDKLDVYQVQYKNSNNIKFYANLSAEEMRDLMLDSDLAISAAGQTIYELLATETPFIAVQTAENQSNNIDELKKIDFFREFTIDDVDNLRTEIIEMFKRLPQNNKMRQKHFYPTETNGEGNIINKLLGYNHAIDNIYLRKVREQDSIDVFALSNADYVRQYSIRKNKILVEEHNIWFNNIIKNKEVFFLVITNDKEEFLGQVRFEKENKNATISISIGEKIKGRGYSKKILGESINYFYRENKKIESIVAIIDKRNIASVNIFKANNFILDKEEEKYLMFVHKRDI